MNDNYLGEVQTVPEYQAAALKRKRKSRNTQEQR